MRYSVNVDKAACRYCGDDEVYMDLKEEPGSYKVGASCHSCDQDYGVIDTVARINLDDMDEVWEMAKESIHRYLE